MKLEVEIKMMERQPCDTNHFGSKFGPCVFPQKKFLKPRRINLSSQRSRPKCPPLDLSSSAPIAAIFWKVLLVTRILYLFATAVERKTKVMGPRIRIGLALITADTAFKTITTTTKASSFPSLLRQKRSAVQTVERSDMQNEAVIQQTCPECGRMEVRYSAVQLRSADEGSTIFYTCDCGHK
jgi:DNA-directed RNA polymerase subunit M/transcription elongation factor TFIIS